MSTVTCANCNSRNIEGSKFCNHCGAALPLSTHIICPNCETRNPRNLMYCDNCGTRLLPTGELSSEREEEKPTKPKSREAPKAFSLPARDPGDELDPNRLLDWLRTGEDQPEGASGQQPPKNFEEQTESRDDMMGGWLDEEPATEMPVEGGMNDWLSELEGMDDGGDPADSSDEDMLPNWLDELNLEDDSEEVQEDSDEETQFDWFGDFNAEEDEAVESPDLPVTDILTSPPRVPTAEEFERSLRVASPFDDDEDDNEGMADWLSGFEETAETPQDPEGSEVADWLNDVSDETDAPTMIGSAEFSDEELGTPDWQSDLGDDDEDDDDEMPTLIGSSPLPQEEEIVDWLNVFDGGGDETPSMIEAAVPSEEEEDLADWFSDLDMEEDSPTMIEAAVPSEEEKDLADWFSDFDMEEDSQTLNEAADSYEENSRDLSDWLSDFNSESEEETPTLIAPVPPTQIEEDDLLPEWLAEEGSEESAALIESVEPGDEDDEQFPDWLSDIDSDEDTPTMVSSAAASDVEEDLPDWLGGFGAEDEEPVTESAVFSETEDEDLPDWLGDIGVEGEEPMTESAVSFEADEEDMPDWLGDFDSEMEDSPTLISASSPFGEDETENLADWSDSPDLVEEDVFGDTVETAGEETVADWLSEFDEEEDVPTLIAQTSSMAEDEEIPDWLSDFEDDSEAESLASDEGILAEDTLPDDWFEDFSDEDTLTLDADLSDVDEVAGGLPDWLSEMASNEAESETASDETDEFFASFQTSNLTPVDEMPDWLTDIAPEGEETAETLADDDLETADDGMPDWLSDLPDEDESFDLDDDTDWLEALNQEEPWPELVDDEELASHLEPTESETETADPAIPSNELKGVPKELVSPSLPDWLQEDMPQMSSLEDEEELAQGELPDWLQQMRPSELSDGEDLGLGDGLAVGDTQDEWRAIFENMPSAERGLGPGDSELSAAEIPAWLQALRPTADSEETEMVLNNEESETEGPLAGLRGVLQVAPYVAQPTASTTMSRYTVSKEQQQQIALLHQLTHEETEVTKQVTVKNSATFSGNRRTLLGVLLFLVVLAGVLLPRTDIPLPETALPVSQSALATFNTIDPLVGGSVLVAFDYTPAMAAELDPIAEMLLRQLATNGNRVLTISQSAAGTTIADRITSDVLGLDSQSLGLLTGEAVGLRSLGRCLNGGDGCDMLFSTVNDSDLQNDLSNLGLVIVLTSDRNSLINWIEQVESETEAPVVVAVTQPLGPLTIPYISSGQLEGSLNGIPSASTYEKRLLGQDGDTFQLFTAQSIGMWVVIIALIVGAVSYGLSGFASRGEKKGKG